MYDGIRDAIKQAQSNTGAETDNQVFKIVDGKVITNKVIYRFADLGHDDPLNYQVFSTE